MSTGFRAHRGLGAPPPTAFEKFIKELELNHFEKSEDGKTILSTCKDCNLSKKTQISLPTDTDKSDTLASLRYEVALLDEFVIHSHGLNFINHYVLPPIFGEYFYDPESDVGGDEYEGYDESEDEHDESEDESGAEEDESEVSGAEDETGKGAAFDHKTEELLDMVEAGLNF